jgi:hypothetical protein
MQFSGRDGDSAMARDVEGDQSLREQTLIFSNEREGLGAPFETL